MWRKVSILNLKKIAPAAVLFFTLAHSLPGFAEWYENHQTIMGTAVTVKLWHDDPAVAQQAIDAVMLEMRRIDITLSPYIESSELATVNREAAKNPVKISQELATIVDKSLYFSRVSDGAFDISYASVGHLYDYRHKRQPTEEERKALMSAINYHLIELDRETPSIHFKHPDLQIDLGGIAKGYAVDRSAKILASYGVEHATVSAGGDSRIIGDKNGEPWVIGIKKPRGAIPENLRTDDATPRDQVAILLPLENTAISTSGDYERYFIDDNGKRVHHILNPKTGTSASGVVSVSILGAQGFDTDPLSTTVFVMGVERGLSLINKMRGFDCVIIDSHGKVHYSDGLMPPVTPDEK